MYYYYYYYLLLFRIILEVNGGYVSFSERWRTTVKCFIDFFKDCRPLLSKFFRVNDVAFCKTEGLVTEFFNAGEQNLVREVSAPISPEPQNGKGKPFY